MDLSKVKVEEYENGYIIAPESEMKKVVIPSPPTVTLVPINPRDAIIYLTKERITPDYAKIDLLKEYVVRENKVLLCPNNSSPETVVETWQYAVANAKTINIKKDIFYVKCDEDSMENVEDAVEALEDEDAEVAEVEILSF